MSYTGKESKKQRIYVYITGNVYEMCEKKVEELDLEGFRREAFGVFLVVIEIKVLSVHLAWH